MFDIPTLCIPKDYFFFLFKVFDRMRGGQAPVDGLFVVDHRRWVFFDLNHINLKCWWQMLAGRPLRTAQDYFPIFHLQQRPMRTSFVGSGQVAQVFALFVPFVCQFLKFKACVVFGCKPEMKTVSIGLNGKAENRQVETFTWEKLDAVEDSARRSAFRKSKL